ncbi:MAG: lasso peptide biosynthesis B2 protein [Allosphingosinicella sp.]
MRRGLVETYRMAGRLGGGRAKLLAEAALRLVLVRAALRLRPFEKVARRFGTFVAPGVRHASDGSRAGAEAAQAVAWAVAVAARRLPGEFVCLPQALAAQAMLLRRGVAASLYLGAGREEAGPFEAHAWVEAAGIAVTGHPVPPQLREMGRFVAVPPDGKAGDAGGGRSVSREQAR